MAELQNGPQALSAGASIDVLRDTPWQMSYGERAALEGLLSQCKPSLAIEIGTAEGGSLERFALHSREVHSFDLVEPSAQARELSNVTFHTGDSHTLLPQTLAEFAEAGRTVDFVLVDGDHSTEGVRRDLEDLLNSPSVSDTLIVMHDTMNEVVRTGLEQVAFEAWPKVAYVELDLVSGYMFREPSLLGELWGGLGLVVTSSGPKPRGRSPRQERYFEAFEVLRRGHGAVLNEADRRRRQADLAAAPLDPADDDAEHPPDPAAERDRALEHLHYLQHEHWRLLRAWDRTMSSFSWRVTRPLRDLKARLQRLLH
jgi:hypothetical protein